MQIKLGELPHEVRQKLLHKQKKIQQKYQQKNTYHQKKQNKLLITLDQYNM